MSGKRDAAERIHDFLEVDTGLSENNAVLEATRCMECADIFTSTPSFIL